MLVNGKYKCFREDEDEESVDADWIMTIKEADTGLKQQLMNGDNDPDQVTIVTKFKNIYINILRGIHWNDSNYSYLDYELTCMHDVIMIWTCCYRYFVSMATQVNTIVSHGSTLCMIS